MKHIHITECTSTLDILKENLNHFNNEESIVVSTDHQTQGRGRGKNVWNTFRHSLAMSFNMKPHPIFTLSTMELGVLVSQFFQQYSQADLKLKWPNDLIKDSCKVGGILVQSFGTNLLVGIGLNLYMDPDESFGDYKVAAGPLFNRPVQSKKNLAVDLAKYIQKNRILSGELVRHQFFELCIHKNSMVEIYDGDNITGQFIGIGEDGHAIVRSETHTKKVYSGSLRLIAS